MKTFLKLLLIVQLLIWSIIAGNVYADPNAPTWSQTVFSRFLDTDGDGTGTKTAVGDYSGGSLDIFYIAPAAGEVFVIERMMISYEDTTGMQAQEYGNTGGALSVGIVVRISNDDGVVEDLTDGVTIKDNGEWGRYCYDVQLVSWGSGNEKILARWTFARHGRPIVLNGDKLEVVLNDDFQGLLDHYFLVQGYQSR